MTSVEHTGSLTARLRPKNQITVPQPALDKVGAKVGDRFRVTVADGAIRLEPIRRSYYGAFRDLWRDNWMEDLRQERDSWERREQALGDTRRR